MKDYLQGLRVRSIGERSARDQAQSRWARIDHMNVLNEHENTVEGS